MTAQSKALFIGGRAGVGKSSVGYEIHAQLSAARIQHCLVEGDNLDWFCRPSATALIGEFGPHSVFGVFDVGEFRPHPGVGHFPAGRQPAGAIR